VLEKGPRGLRVSALTGVLVLLLAVAGGFWGGVALQKHHGGSSSSSSALSRVAAAARAAGAGTGSRLGAGGFGAATAGTVIGVSGDVLQVSDSSGNIVKVTVGPSATVTRTSSEPLSGLKIGDTVVVSGSSESNGSVTATAVRASAPGASAGFGGGSGFAGPGAGG